MTICSVCGEESWTTVRFPLGHEPLLCLGCTALHADQAPSIAVLAWADRFLRLVAERAISPLQKGSPTP